MNLRGGCIDCEYMLYDSTMTVRLSVHKLVSELLASVRR